ncbi:MAG: glycoside hydrolase [Treponema sp.]|jgi:spore germination protein YaaH|nr:glycoside hydrolase [Treponema sp.]
MRFPGRLIVVLLWAGLAFSACRSSPSHTPDETGKLESILGAEEESTASGDEQTSPQELALPEPPPDLPVSEFREIWGYVLSGQESSLGLNYPLSDVGYFSAEINSYGQLVNVPNVKRLARFQGRLHLVAVCESGALTHFVLAPGEVRQQLIADLLSAARNFAGLQIDFELVPARDGELFRSFLGELRAGLGNKLFTVALPARVKTLNNDVYDYAKIAPLADRVFVMAYDEHWATSKPGSIASLDWCRQVAAYSLKTIGADKLVMGLPFYGRTWGSVNTFRAFFFSGIERIKKEHDITDVRRENGIPTFSYEVPVTVTVYYEDEYSLSRRLELYRNMGVISVGFWRIGQETPVIWQLLKISKE